MRKYIKLAGVAQLIRAMWLLTTKSEVQEGPSSSDYRLWLPLRLQHAAQV